MRVLVPLAVVAAALMFVTLELVRLRRLKERYAALWVGFAVVGVSGVLFPGVVTRISQALGFEVTANLVISSGLVALALVAIQLSVDITRLRGEIERIVSRLAVIEKTTEGTPVKPPDADATGG